MVYVRRSRRLKRRPAFRRKRTRRYFRRRARPVRRRSYARTSRRNYALPGVRLSSSTRRPLPQDPIVFHEWSVGFDPGVAGTTRGRIKNTFSTSFAAAANSYFYQQINARETSNTITGPKPFAPSWTVAPALDDPILDATTTTSYPPFYNLYTKLYRRYRIVKTTVTLIFRPNWCPSVNTDTIQTTTVTYNAHQPLFAWISFWTDQDMAANDVSAMPDMRMNANTRYRQLPYHWSGTQPIKLTHSCTHTSMYRENPMFKSQNTFLTTTALGYTRTQAEAVGMSTPIYMAHGICTFDGRAIDPTNDLPAAYSMNISQAIKYSSPHNTEEFNNL